MSYVLVIKERFKIFPNNRKQLNPSPSNYQRPKHSWKFPENSWSAKNCIYCLIECNGVLTQCDSSQRVKYAAEYSLQRAILASSIHYCTMIIISSHLLTRDWAYAAPPATDDDDDGDDGVGLNWSPNCHPPVNIWLFHMMPMMPYYHTIVPPTVVHQPVLGESPLLLNSATVSLFHRLA